MKFLNVFLLLAWQCVLTQSIKLQPGFTRARWLFSNGNARNPRQNRRVTGREQRNLERSQSEILLAAQEPGAASNPDSLWRAAVSNLATDNTQDRSAAECTDCKVVGVCFRHGMQRSRNVQAGNSNTDVETSVFSRVSGQSGSDGGGGVVEGAGDRWSNPSPFPSFQNPGVHQKQSDGDSSARFNVPDSSDEHEYDDGSSRKEPEKLPLCNVFGYKLIALIVIGQWLIHGFVMSVVKTPIDFIFKDIHVPADRMQLFCAVIDMPWQLKPVIGLAADRGWAAVRGYKKAPLVAVSSIFSVLALLFLWRINIYSTPPQFIVLAVFLIMVQMSTVDLLTEAKCAEAMRDAPTRRSDLISFVWAGTFGSKMLGKVFVGLMLTNVSRQAGYLILMPLAASIIFPACRNYFQEVPQSHKQIRARRKSKVIAKSSGLAFLCGTMFIATIVMAFSGMMNLSSNNRAVLALSTAIFVLGAFSLLLNPIIAKINAFFLLNAAMYVNVSGASFYFYTDSKEMYRDGPHFDTFFVATVIPGIVQAAALVGVFGYKRWFGKWNHQTLLITMNLFQGLLCVLDVILYRGLNLKWGIPDSFFVIGSSVAIEVIHEFVRMPGMVILSQVCPEGNEAIMFALLAGCQKFGGSLSKFLGTFVLTQLNVDVNGSPDDGKGFRNLWIAPLISVAAALIMSTMIPWLIPDACASDEIVPCEDSCCETGSIWKSFSSRSRSDHDDDHYKPPGAVSPITSRTDLLTHARHLHIGVNLPVSTATQVQGQRGYVSRYGSIQCQNVGLNIHRTRWPETTYSIPTEFTDSAPSSAPPSPPGALDRPPAPRSRPSQQNLHGTFAGDVGEEDAKRDTRMERSLQMMMAADTDLRQELENQNIGLHLSNQHAQARVVNAVMNFEAGLLSSGDEEFPWITVDASSRPSSRAGSTPVVLSSPDRHSTGASTSFSDVASDASSHGR